MKIYLVVVVFAFLCVPLLAQQGRMVAVTAEKEAEIKNNDIAAARKVALALATREAVEKAYGTYIKLEELPEARRIIATASAGLKYQILAEQQKKNRYWVKIQAEVIVPAEYLKEESFERESLGEGMGSYMQKYPQGEINWAEGMVIAHGKGEITEKGPQGEDIAARAAELDAKAHLLEIINDIPVDDRGRVGQDQRLAFVLEGFVRDSEVVARSKTGTVIHVTVQAGIRGLKGLSMTALGYYTPPQPPPPPPPVPAVAENKPPIAPADARAFTGIVVDARKLTANASLFPRIQDTGKQEVYSVGTVNKEDLQKRGMASFAVVSRDATISKFFPNAIVVNASYRIEEAPANTKRRQGDTPLLLTPLSTDGELKTNIVLSDEDAERVRQLNERTGALRECRIVIVLSPENLL